MINTNFRFGLLFFIGLLSLNFVLADCYQDCYQTCSTKCEISYPKDEITPLAAGFIATTAMAGTALVFYFLARKMQVIK